MEFIRKFNHDDLESVMKIWLEGNLEAHDFVDPEYWKQNYGFVSRKIPLVETYVYEINGNISGFVGVDAGYVAGLFVSKEYRGLGLGTRLLNYIKEDNKKLYLHVFEKNKSACTFYKKGGFLKAKEETNEDLGEIEYYMIYQKKFTGCY